VEVALNRVERSFRVEGEEGLGSKPRPELIGPLLTSLPNTLLDAVRMGFLHSSRAKGRVPSLLKTAADIRFVGIDGEGNDTTWLHFEVAPFEAVARELFQQQKLWDEIPKPDETAFELLGAALEDIAIHQKDSDRFDSGLLNRVKSYRRILERGVRSITLPDAHLPTQARVDQAVVKAASDLVAITPNARRVRVTGRLDVMGASQSVLKLQVRPGQYVMARWEGPEPIDSLRELFNREILVEGMGIFRPSGGLLRIDADTIAEASSSDESFRHIPVAHSRRDFQRLVRLKPREESAYARLLGSIPAEESDEEFIAAVEAMS
jgi:hypothetical protein